MSDTHAQTVAYVRETMLPEQDPPLTQVGAIKWVRENLFSGWVNILLTVVSLFVIYWALSLVLPWAFGGVWDAGSLNECREVLSAFGKGTHDGACWAVIEDRWLQLLFGFYPPEFYWRPILALALMFVALAPVLFPEKVPGKLLAFTAIYPFLAVWLIWGGSIWAPILVILGFVAGWFAYGVGARFGGMLLGSIAAIAGALIWWMAITPVANDALHRMVGSMRLGSVQAQLEEKVAALPGQIAQIEADQEALTTQIADEVAAKNEIVATVEGLLEGATDDDGHADLSMLSDADRAALEDAQVALTSRMDTLASLRDDASKLAQANFRVSDELSSARGLSGSIQALPGLQDSLPELRADADALRDALPRNLRGLSSAALAPEGTLAEDLSALEDYLAARNDVLNTENAIAETFSTLGRVGLEPVESREIGGFMLAIIIGLAGIVLSLPFGILLALGRQSDLLIINKSSVAFIEIIRGVPLIVWLFTASLLLNYFLPPGTNFDLMLRVIIMVTFFASAYIAEVVRGGLAALPTGQYEAADALGLDYWKSMRLIILPQALKISIPGIVNTFIGLFKDTTLVVFIGLLDPIGLSNSIRASTDWNGIYWELFVFIGLMFFIFCFSMGRYSLFLEKKLQREHR